MATSNSMRRMARKATVAKEQPKLEAKRSIGERTKEAWQLVKDGKAKNIKEAWTILKSK